jgi:uncharacterized protein YoxC
MNLSEIQQALDGMNTSAIDVPSEQIDSLRRLVSALTEKVARLSDDLRYAHDRLDAVDHRIEERT